MVFDGAKVQGVPSRNYNLKEPDDQPKLTFLAFKVYHFEMEHPVK